MTYLTLKTKINDIVIALEPELSGYGIRISERNKDGVKNGVSAHYMKTQSGKYVPVDLQVYESGICGKSYTFDCVTGMFTQFVDFGNGCKLVGMDKWIINKHKNDANNYYEKAKNMLCEFTKTKCPFNKAVLYKEFGIR